MPIEHSKHGATTITGDSIDFFRLAALKGAVSLEIKGIRMSRRVPPAWKMAKAEFGIKGNKEAVYRWLCDKVAELRTQQEHRVEEDGRLKREVDGKEVN